MTGDKRQRAIEDFSLFIKDRVASGFATLDEIVPEALEIAAIECPSEDFRLDVERVLREAIAEQLASEATWPTVTDCDRLDAAFAELERAGVVCRQNFSCCGTCAAGEIWDEIAAERNKGREVIGCAHYNCQDISCAIAGHGIYLSYGSVLTGERPAVEIGHLVAKAMRDQGLTVIWNGSFNQGIHVAMSWKRRLPTAMR